MNKYDKIINTIKKIPEMSIREYNTKIKIISMRDKDPSNILINNNVYSKIKTKEQYKEYLKIVRPLFDIPDDEMTEAQEIEFDILTNLIISYEKIHYPIPTCDPISAIEFMMEQNDLSIQDMIDRFSCDIIPILEKKEYLYLDMIRKLRKELHIPADILMKEYKIIPPKPAPLKRVLKEDTGLKYIFIILAIILTFGIIILSIINYL